MDVILLQKVKNLGNLGDKVRVKPGYSRNFLIPYGKAVPATAANIAEFETSRAAFEARANEVLAAALARKAKLEGQSVTIRANASTEGKLYGSVGPREIAESFTTAGLPLEKAEVIMGEGPLRRVGDFDVEVHLHADVHMTVKVVIQPEA